MVNNYRINNESNDSNLHSLHQDPCTVYVLNRFESVAFLSQIELMKLLVVTNLFKTKQAL